VILIQSLFEKKAFILRIHCNKSIVCCHLLLLDINVTVSLIIQGSHASWKILESPRIFIRKFSWPGKSWKMTLVLESPGNLLARSWKVLEFARQWRTWMFLVSNGHVYVDENSNNCIHQVRFLGCRYAKNAFTAGVPPWTPLAELTALPRLLSWCLLPYLNIADLRQAPGKMLLGVWKSPGFFCNQESGNPDYTYNVV